MESIRSILEQQVADAEWFILVTSQHPGQAVIRGRTLADEQAGIDQFQLLALSGMKDWKSIEITVRSVNGGEVNGDMTLADLGRIMRDGIRQEIAKRQEIAHQERLRDALGDAIESVKAEIDSKKQ